MQQKNKHQQQRQFNSFNGLECIRIISNVDRFSVVIDPFISNHTIIVS